MIAAVNGYGVPEDIFTDPNYRTYLAQVFNTLWKRYGDAQLTIVLLGGYTAFFKPYRRSEAGEMARWFRREIKKRGLTELWTLDTITTEYNTLGNMKELRELIGTKPVLYFCEETRGEKCRILGHEIFGRKIRVMPIDFDMSPRRYDTMFRTAQEKEDLRYSLWGVKNPVARDKLKWADWEKIEKLRALPRKQRAANVDIIARAMRKKYLKRPH